MTSCAAPVYDFPILTFFCRHVIWTPSPFDSYAGGAFYAVYNSAANNLTGTRSPQFLADRIAQVIEGVADALAPDYYF